jgi:hypothetical protein
MEEVIKTMDRHSSIEDMDSVLLSHGERDSALCVGQQSRCHLDPRRVTMSESTEQNVDVQETEVNPTTEQDNTPVNGDAGDTPEQPTTPAEVAVEVSTEPEVQPPTVEELLLKGHKERVLGKDRISAKQMSSYLKFLTDKGDEFADEVMGTHDENVWKAVARGGKSAVPNGKDVDDKFVALWNEWKSEQQDPGSISKSHMWLKGVCAAALLIAMHNDEQTEGEENTDLYAPVLEPVEEQPEEERETAEADAAAVVAQEENSEPDTEASADTEESGEESDEDDTEDTEEA